MTYTWDSSLETGNQTIDEQHKQLVVAVNDLLKACRRGCGKRELEKTIDFLISYTVQHFHDEEELQKQSNYPDYLRHRKIHEDFKVVAANFAERLRIEGATVALVAEVYSSLGDWLLNHIKGDDFKMAAYLQSRKDN